MTKTLILSRDEIREKLKDLPGWGFEDDKISKELRFNGFMDAVAFINKLAPICESYDHHPDIHIFYNKILFELQRFDVGGKVTDKDILIAQKIEELYEK